jgi:flagellar hook-basal body complex protein FliE
VPIVVEGIVGLKKALRNYAPDLQKEFDKEVREAMKEVIAAARVKVPPSTRLYNWNNTTERKSRTGREKAFPAYDQSLIRKGMTYSLGSQRRNKTGFVSMFTLFNKSAIGAIVETAGRANPGGSNRSKSNNPDAGRNFNTTLSNEVGALKSYQGSGNRKTQGRLLFAAYAENQGKALDRIMKAIAKAEQEFNARIKADSRKMVA